MSADPKSGQALGSLGSRRQVRPRHSLVMASGWAALLTGVVAVWMAAEIRIAGSGWLPWLAIALPPAAAGGLCLARRAPTSTGPAAVFASCATAGVYALQLPAGRHGLALAVSLFLLLCAGVSVIISATITAVMISISGAVLRLWRAAMWTAAGLVFAALSIPSPVYFSGHPIQTIFAGNTSGENALAICNLGRVAVPLVVTGLASGWMATVLVLAWLPEAAAQLLGGNVFRFFFLHVDAWFWVSWLALLGIAMLGPSWRRGTGGQAGILLARYLTLNRTSAKSGSRSPAAQRQSAPQRAGVS